jgi:hypothetical protein
MRHGLSRDLPHIPTNIVPIGTFLIEETLQFDQKFKCVAPLLCRKLKWCGDVPTRYDHTAALKDVVGVAKHITSVVLYEDRILVCAVLDAERAVTTHDLCPKREMRSSPPPGCRVRNNALLTMTCRSAYHPIADIT